MKCDECKSALAEDSYGFLICPRCGLVHEAVSEHTSVYAQVPSLSRQRLGSLISRYPSYKTGKRDLPEPVLQKFKRLRELQDSTYRGSFLNLFQLHQDLEFVVDYLQLPREVVDKTFQLFQEVTSKVQNPYNNYALLMAICLTVVSRGMGERAPVKISEIVKAFGLRGHKFSIRVLAKALYYSTNLIPSSRKFRQSEEFVGKVISKLKVAPYISVRVRASKIDVDDYFNQLELSSKELLSKTPSKKRAGKNPFLLAASAVFMSSSMIAKRCDSQNFFTIQQFSKDVGIAEYTLRSHLTNVLSQPIPLAPAQ